MPVDPTRRRFAAAVALALCLALSAPAFADHRPLRNGARAVGSRVVSVLKRVAGVVVRPFKRGGC